MEETKLSKESTDEIGFSETEMAAAELLMQLSEEETMSCSSSTGGDSGGGRGGGDNQKTRHEDVSSRIENEQNDDVLVDCVEKKRKRKIEDMKEKKFRSIESIYRETKKI